MTTGALTIPGPGGRETKRLLFGVLGAVGLHAAIVLVPGRPVNGPAPRGASWALLEIADELVRAEPLPAPEAAPTPPATDLAPPTALRGGSTERSSPAPATDSVGAGSHEPDAGDEAAPIETADFGEADWSMPSGQGSTFGGSRGFGVGSVGARAARSTVLEARDLSREASAPDLLPWVERNFPQIARMYRVEGVVTVSALLDEFGTPSDVRVDSVDPPGRGFGEACARTLHQGPKWRPKLNRDGRPVKTAVTYRCAFRLPADLEKSAAPPTESASQRIWTHSAE